MRTRALIIRATLVWAFGILSYQMQAQVLGPSKSLKNKVDSLQVTRDSTQTSTPLSQKDKKNTREDKSDKSKSKTEITTKSHSPKKAGIYSAILPGLGQAYNEKYWKIPIIYAAGGFTVYSALEQQRQYLLFRKLNALNKNGFDISSYSSQLEELNKSNPKLLEAYRDEARNTRDLYFLYTTVVYALNIVDALVDGHLKEFDVSEDLSMHIDPSLQFTNPVALPQYSSKPMGGFTVSLTF